jgi:2-polyprenyl-3-methyl-5-hydroxy-6-metoxy-1,4-benzoquinol methylase
MTSESGSVANDRPFYASFADAYDLLITDPVEPWVTAVSGAVSPRSRASVMLLDAGCGTGRQAAAFADAGYVVEMADASKDLLAIASRRSPGIPAHLIDITEFRLAHEFDVVTCRGVLNDILGAQDRRAALQCLADHVRPGGRLILDVRETNATVARQPTKSSMVVQSSAGEVVFDNETEWSASALVSHETFTLTEPSGAVASTHYDFTMQPWTELELRELIAAVGLEMENIEVARYRANGDRLFVIARRDCEADRAIETLRTRV